MTATSITGPPSSSRPARRRDAASGDSRGFQKSQFWLCNLDLGDSRAIVLPGTMPDLAPADVAHHIGELRRFSSCRAIFSLDERARQDSNL